MNPRLVALALVMSLAAPVTASANSEGVARESFAFYGGVVVSAVQHADGNIMATVRATQKGPALGSLHLDLRTLSAVWSGRTAAGNLDARFYDLSSPERQRVLRSHTLRSAALSALLHYEDQQGAVIPASRLSAQSCQPVTDGCSNWFDECGGISTRAACEAHYACYQCALGTRRECDRALFDDIVSLTHGDYACASAYYLGVRMIGWLVYQDPTLRPYLGPDMYSLGIELNACEGYEYLCTTYVF